MYQKMKINLATIATHLVLQAAAVLAQTSFDDSRFQQVVEKLEADAFELRDQVESLYTKRCDSLSTCQQANYDDCYTSFPNPTCPAGLDYHIEACGATMTCSGEYDFSVSSFSLPPSTSNGQGGNPTDPRVLESVCFTRELDTWFQEKRSSDASFWSQYGFAPQSMFFGSNTGTFRIHPARHSENCGVYDPRVRPWYVAGGSGRKNVIMVLDKSGSMDGRLLGLLKEAAKRVINTLTVGDRVAIVFFDSRATLVADDGQFLFEATDENKSYLTGVVDKLEAGGATNFYDAFNKAFDVLDASTKQEFTVSCNTAILFLTDGVISPDVQPYSAVYALVDQRLTASRLLTGKPILLFTYSISADEDVHEFPSNLACTTEYGIWSRIDDEDQIVNALSSYYLLFALGLGSDANSDFAAWVEPYAYSTGGVLGTTVSVPVYDRSKSPNLFLGVIGIDMAVSTLDAALGATDSSQSIQRLAARSVARCPELALTPCELDFYRLATSGQDARCLANNCTDDDFVQTQDKECGVTKDSYPSDIFTNKDLQGMSYGERACCAVDGADPLAQTCGTSSSPSASAKLIIGISAGVVTAVLLADLFVLYKRRKKGQHFGSDSHTDQDQGSSVPSLPEPMAPPINPQYKPSAPPEESSQS